MGLQIFERRYLDMISSQLKQNAGFGVVPIREGREVGKTPLIYPLGVEVRIADWHQLPNGMLGITIVGERRLRILDSEVQSDNLMRARVQYLEEVPAEPIDEEFQGLADLLENLKEHPAAASLALPPVQDSNQLSYQLAQLLPLSAEDKMRALTTASPRDRLRLVARKISALAQT